jgi:hypothetical protein
MRDGEANAGAGVYETWSQGGREQTAITYSNPGDYL